LRERLRAEHGGDERRVLGLLVLLQAPRKGPLVGLAATLALGAAAVLALFVWAPWHATERSAAANGLASGVALAEPSNATTSLAPAAQSARTPAAEVLRSATLVGRVLTSTGEPIAGASIEVHQRAAAGLALSAGAFGRDDRTIARTA